MIQKDEVTIANTSYRHSRSTPYCGSQLSQYSSSSHSFSKIPTDIHLLIARYLSAVELQQLGQVSQNLRHVYSPLSFFDCTVLFPDESIKQDIRRNSGQRHKQNESNPPLYNMTLSSIIFTGGVTSTSKKDGKIIRYHTLKDHPKTQHFVNILTRAIPLDVFLNPWNYSWFLQQFVVFIRFNTPDLPFTKRYVPDYDRLSNLYTQLKSFLFEVPVKVFFDEFSHTLDKDPLMISVNELCGWSQLKSVYPVNSLPFINESDASFHDTKDYDFNTLTEDGPSQSLSKLFFPRKEALKAISISYTTQQHKLKLPLDIMHTFINLEKVELVPLAKSPLSLQEYASFTESLSKCPKLKSVSTTHFVGYILDEDRVLSQIVERQYNRYRLGNIKSSISDSSLGQYNENDSIYENTLLSLLKLPEDIPICAVELIGENETDSFKWSEFIENNEELIEEIFGLESLSKSLPGGNILNLPQITNLRFTGRIGTLNDVYLPRLRSLWVDKFYHQHPMTAIKPKSLQTVNSLFLIAKYIEDFEILLHLPSLSQIAVVISNKTIHQSRHMIVQKLLPYIFEKLLERYNFGNFRDEFLQDPDEDKYVIDIPDYLSRDVTPYCIKKIFKRLLGNPCEAITAESYLANLVLSDEHITSLADPENLTAASAISRSNPDFTHLGDNYYNLYPHRFCEAFFDYMLRSPCCPKIKYIAIHQTVPIEMNFMLHKFLQNKEKTKSLSQIFVMDLAMSPFTMFQTNLTDVQSMHPFGGNVELGNNLQPFHIHSKNKFMSQEELEKKIERWFKLSPAYAEFKKYTRMVYLTYYVDKKPKTTNSIITSQANSQDNLPEEFMEYFSPESEYFDTDDTASEFSDDKDEYNTHDDSNSQFSNNNTQNSSASPPFSEDESQSSTHNSNESRSPEDIYSIANRQRSWIIDVAGMRGKYHEQDYFSKTGENLNYVWRTTTTEPVYADHASGSDENGTLRQRSIYCDEKKNFQQRFFEDIFKNNSEPLYTCVSMSPRGWIL